MRECETQLAEFEPRTLYAAEKMLSLPITIMNYRAIDPDPTATLGQGPVVEILRLVKEAMNATETVRLSKDQQRPLS